MDRFTKMKKESKLVMGMAMGHVRKGGQAA